MHGIDDLFEATKDIEVTGTDILFTLMMIIKEDGNLFIAIVFSLQIDPVMKTRDEPLKILCHGLINIKNLTSGRVADLLFGSEYSRFNKTGQLRGDNGPCHRVCTNTNLALPPLFYSVFIKTNTIYDGDIQSGKVTGQIRSQG